MDLFENPFYTLGASPKDDLRKLRLLSSERAKTLDRDLVSEAEAVLSDPARRITAELSWLPGVKVIEANRAVAYVFSKLNLGTGVTKDEIVTLTQNFGPLAKANFLCSCLKWFTFPDFDPILGLMVEISESHRGIIFDNLLRFINEDRREAGMKPVPGTADLESQFLPVRRHYIKVMVDEINAMATPDAIKIVNELTGSFFENDKQIPNIIHDVVSVFENEAQLFLKTEERNMSEVIKILQRSLTQNEDDATLERVAEQLVKITRNWEKVMRSVQRCALARKVKHPRSMSVYKALKELAESMRDHYKKFGLAMKILNLMHDIFSVIPELRNAIIDDIYYLTVNRDLSVKSFANFKKITSTRYFTYASDDNQSTLTFDGEGISVKHTRLPYGGIHKLCWGKVRENSRNNNNSFRVSIGDMENVITVYMDDEAAYNKLTMILMDLFGGRVIKEYLEELKNGSKFKFQNVILSDDCVKISNAGTSSQKQNTVYLWRNIDIKVEDNLLKMISLDNLTSFAEIPMLEEDNLELLKVIIQHAKKYNTSHLSELLRI
jgi:hypothetical protein